MEDNIEVLIEILYINKHISKILHKFSTKVVKNNLLLHKDKFLYRKNLQTTKQNMWKKEKTFPQITQ